MLNNIKNFFKALKAEPAVHYKQFKTVGFMQDGRLQKHQNRCEKYANLNLAELLYHPAITDEDFKKVDDLITDLSNKCRNYLTGPSGK